MARSAIAAQPEPLNLGSVRERALKIERQLSKAFVDRNDQIRALTLATFAGEHILFIGDPGTGKTALCTTYAKHFAGGRYWKRTLGSFTPPEKLVGPLDISKFQLGKYEHQIDGAVPSADLACFDELMKGSQVVNELLEILGPERAFDFKPIPLISASAATNWPEVLRRDEIVSALYDRFLLRVVVPRLEGAEKRVAVMRAAARVQAYVPTVTIGIEELRRSVDVIGDSIVVDDVYYEIFAELLTAIEASAKGSKIAPIFVSDRRAGQLIKVLKVSAWMRGSDRVTIDDFGALLWGIWDGRDDIEVAKVALKSIGNTEVSEAVTQITMARELFTTCKQAGFQPAALNAMLNAMREVGTVVHSICENPRIGEAAQAKIKRAMDPLRADFIELKAVVDRA